MASFERSIDDQAKPKSRWLNLIGDENLPYCWCYKPCRDEDGPPMASRLRHVSALVADLKGKQKQEEAKEKEGELKFV